MSKKTITLIAALLACAALWAQDVSEGNGIQDVGGIPEVAASAAMSRFLSGPIATDPSRISSRPSLRPSSQPVYSGPLMPSSRASTFGWSAGIWTSAARIENEADPLIDASLEGLWHLPYLGNALALGCNVSWKGDVGSELNFMVFGLEAEGRFYFSPRLPYWVGLRAGPTYYFLNYAGVSDTLRLLGYIDVGISYPLGSLGLEVRGTVFFAGESSYGFGLSVGYAAIKGR